jgi:hypothetical protein
MFLKKIKIGLPYNPAIITIGIYLKEYQDVSQDTIETPAHLCLLQSCSQ